MQDEFDSEDAEQEAEKELTLAYQQFFNTAHGRMILADLIIETRFNEPDFDPASPDIGTTGYRGGAKMPVYHILSRAGKTKQEVIESELES